MQLTPEQIDAHLATQLAAVYFISGDEPLRVMEAADAVRAAARAQGYDEREVLTLQPGFDWDSLLAGSGNMSLFSQRRIIELRMPTGKPGDAGSKALRAYTERLPEDTLLLITAGKLEAAARKSKWVQALDKAGVVMFVWPLSGGEFTAWVQQRMRQRGLKPTAEAVTLLTDRVEGNLLACMQEIDKLVLLQDDGVVDAEAVMSLVGDNAALSGEGARSVRVLQGLRAEGVVPQIVIWALAREIRQLASMAAVVESGQSIQKVLGQYRVWAARKSLVGGALKRLRATDCNGMLQHCALIDRISKGQAGGKAWDELLQLTLQLAGTPVLPVMKQAGQPC